MTLCLPQINILMTNLHKLIHQFKMKKEIFEEIQK
jgi:hypothetical protein